MSGPDYVQIELSSNCNLKCKMCPLTSRETLSSKNAGDMTSTMWEKVLDVAKRADSVIFAGFGEALTSAQSIPRLCEMDQFGVPMGISTNGTAINEKNAEKLASLKNLIHINVSIDSPDPNVYRSIRGGELEKALSGVKKLLDAFQEKDKEKITISSVLLKDGIGSLSSFPRILRKIGAKKWVLQSTIDNTLHSRMDGLAESDKARNEIANIREAALKEGVNLEYTLPSRISLELQDASEARRLYHSAEKNPAGWTRQCCLPWESTYIDKDGRVFPCCFAATDPDAVMGNLQENPFEEIWKGHRYAAFRRDILEGGKAMPNICKRCNVVSLGVHPLVRVSAEFVSEHSKLSETSEIVAAMRNTGHIEWTRETNLYIGTAGLRDHVSSLFHDTWFCASRTTGMEQEKVGPGEIATFRFRATDGETRVPESFQLVAEGLAWIPGTRFEVPPKPRFVENGYNATLAEGINFLKRPGYPMFIQTVRGMSDDEPGGRWTDGQEVRIEFRSSLPTFFLLRIEIQRAFQPLVGSQMSVRIGDWKENIIVKGRPQTHVLTVKTCEPESVIVFNLSDPVSPREIGVGSDQRRLGVKLYRVSIHQPTFYRRVMPSIAWRK